jgi:nucleotide-binding universal stress UspA family protein
VTIVGRILYVVGFDDTESAISWQVAALSKAWRAPILLLGVRRARWLPFLDQDDRRALKRATVDVAKRLRGLRAHVAGIKVAFGDVAEHACRVADQGGAGLIMVGAGIEAMDDPRSMSAAALAIGRNARQDVWICKPFADPHVDHVLCAADTSPLAGEAVQRAAAICRPFNARLRVLSVLLESPPPLPNAARDDPDEALLAGRRHQKSFLDQFDLAGIALSRAVVRGPQTPVELLLEAEQYCDGVLVMGAIGRDRARRRLGATTEAVLRACPSSVLIVRGKPLAAGTPAGMRLANTEAAETAETADGG